MMLSTKQLFFKITLLCSLFLMMGANAPKRILDNPQLSMVGTRALSLGSSSPALEGDLTSIFVNPAALGSITPMPFSISQQSLINAFDIHLFQYSSQIDLPLIWVKEAKKLKLNYGLSFGSNSSDDIPSTILESDTLIRQVGDFNSGFQALALTGSTTFYNELGFDQLYAGINLKYLRQFIASNARSTATFDAGLIGVLNQKIWIFHRITAGMSILNVLPRTLKWQDDLGEATLPFQILIGAKADTYKDKLSFFAHNTNNGFALGSEYFFQDNMILRGSTTFDKINIGTGILFEQLGFGTSFYSARLDINYTQNQKPLDTEPSYALGLTILGGAQLMTPEILIPRKDKTINQSEIFLKGIGPRSSIIRLYNNDTLVRTVNSDKYGFWKKDNFPLKEGDNMITAKAYSIEKDDSSTSKPRKVNTDTIPPALDVTIYPTNRQLIISAKTEDDINRIYANIDNTPLKFYKIKEGEWQATTSRPKSLSMFSPPPKKMKVLTISATDEAGNELKPAPYPFFIEIETPAAKKVHYSNEIRFIGQASPLVKSLQIDERQVNIDQDLNFSFVHRLSPGKNPVDIILKTLNDVEMVHSARILYLTSYDDIQNIPERREIEFLSTLGVLSGEKDGNFYPDEPISRRYLTRLMVSLLDLKLPNVTANPFPDISSEDPDAAHILAAIQNGLMYADISGLYNPDQELTQDEVTNLLYNADIIEEVEPSNTLDAMTRKELAQFLAFTPNYERQIERLIDWNIGY